MRQLDYLEEWTEWRRIAHYDATRGRELWTFFLPEENHVIQHLLDRRPKLQVVLDVPGKNVRCTVWISMCRTCMNQNNIMANWQPA